MRLDEAVQPERLLHAPWGDLVEEVALPRWKTSLHSNPLNTSALSPCCIIQNGAPAGGKEFHTDVTPVSRFYFSCCLLILLQDRKLTVTKPRRTSWLSSLPATGSVNRGGVHPHHQPSERTAEMLPSGTQPVHTADEHVWWIFPFKTNRGRTAIKKWKMLISPKASLQGFSPKQFAPYATWPSFSALSFYSLAGGETCLSKPLFLAAGFMMKSEPVYSSSTIRWNQSSLLAARTVGIWWLVELSPVPFWGENKHVSPQGFKAFDRAPRMWQHGKPLIIPQRRISRFGSLQGHITPLTSLFLWFL